MLQVLDPRLFALSECRELAASISQSAELELNALEERRFEGGEFKLRPLESVRLAMRCRQRSDSCGYCSFCAG
jgi:phosphoribosylpyrophosphate synthetase